MTPHMTSHEKTKKKSIVECEGRNIGALNKFISSARRGTVGRWKQRYEL